MLAHNPESKHSWIAATGSYLPEQVVRNEDLTQFPANSIRLIEEKTGILARRFAAPDQCTSDLAAAAGRVCLERAGVSPMQLDGIVVATSSPDRPQPATATRVQHLLGASNAFAFDINSVCSGAVFAMAAANAMIACGASRMILVVAAEVYSRITNPRDFSTYPYFGDGAGAVLLSAERGRFSIADIILYSDGSGSETIQVPAGGSMKPFTPQLDRERYFTMRGKDVFEFAITKGPELLATLMHRCAITPEDVSGVMCHQANINIIQEIALRSGIPPDRFVVNLDKYGNTAAASVLIAFDEFMARPEPPSSAHILLATFGGGLSWGGVAIREGRNA